MVWNGHQWNRVLLLVPEKVVVGYRESGKQPADVLLEFLV